MLDKRRHRRQYDVAALPDEVAEDGVVACPGRPELLLVRPCEQLDDVRGGERERDGGTPVARVELRPVLAGVGGGMEGARAARGRTGDEERDEPVRTSGERRRGRLPEVAANSRVVLEDQKVSRTGGQRFEAGAVGAPRVAATVRLRVRDKEGVRQCVCQSADKLGPRRVMLNYDGEADGQSGSGTVTSPCWPSSSPHVFDVKWKRPLSPQPAPQLLIAVSRSVAGS